ncbi:MAG: 3-dehydroquinate dehydratase [Gemmatimonadetes bacterium]|jgi:3-dehydroquinate dehydratase-2|nr:3-dehydroquinate dehydratase [Gemmatimonadota bacterium]MEE2906094.1 type II 3-dehydroquinate dehydratase [Gemmatimonadota bacterium]|tara:strand:- start:67 stop:501 length:435 start_codon:yes stop_codon:yes gene_type:complete
MRIAVIHGTNLRLLGSREPEVYGTDTLDDVNLHLGEVATELGVDLETFQSNHVGEILDFIEEAAARVDGFIINPGALTHTSIALLDAFLGVGRPFVEVHLSNTQGRESYRRHSYLAGSASGVVLGFGVHSYLLGLRGLVARLGG